MGSPPEGDTRCIMRCCPRCFARVPTVSEDQRKRLLRVTREGLRVARENERPAVSVRVPDWEPHQTSTLSVVFTGGSQSEQLRAAAAWLDEHEHTTALSMSVGTELVEAVMVLTMFVDDGVYRP